MSDGNQPQPSIGVIRSHEYRTISSDVFRTRIGLGECTIILGKAGHVPSINPEASILEEQLEVLVSWTNLKILAAHLMSITAAIEAELGPILVPASVLESRGRNFEHHRELIRGLQLAAIPAFTPESLFGNAGRDQPAAESATPDSETK